ncbi:hypothetical protein Tco_0228906 [Tanacetum coccineum]
MLGSKKYIKYNGVRNTSYPMWVIFEEGLYGERFKLGDGVDEEEEDNQRIDYETNKEANNTEKEVSFGTDEFNTSPGLSSSDDANEIKLEDMSKLVKDVDVDLMDLDSLEDDEPIIVQDEEEEEVHAEAHTSQNLKLEKVKDGSEANLLKAQPSYPNVEQLTELLVQNLKTYVEGLTTIPKKLKEFQYANSGLSKQVAELKNLKLEVPAGLLALPGQVSSITAQLSKLKTLDALPSLLNKRRRRTQNKPQSPSYSNKELKKMLSSPLKTTSQPKGELVKKKGKGTMTHEETKEKESETNSDAEANLTEQINEQKKIDQSTKDDLAMKEVESEKEELVDLLGIDLVTNVYKAKMKYDKYCDKMINRRALVKITSCVTLSRGKDPITLKVYRKDGFNDTIPNFKASDLHLAE